MPGAQDLGAYVPAPSALCLRTMLNCSDYRVNLLCFGRRADDVHTVIVRIRYIPNDKENWRQHVITSKSHDQS